MLGSLSGIIGKIYGQIPIFINYFVALIAITMGLNLLGLIKIQMPNGPDPNNWIKYVPEYLGPTTAGLAFGLASTPCTTPVLAALLAWVSQSKNPLLGIIFLGFFGLGQVVPLLLAAITTANVTSLLRFRQVSQWIPPISGGILLSLGMLSLISQWF